MKLSQETISVLASTPPTAGKIRISTVRDADARIRELETALNIPRGKFISHIREANGRVLALESMLASSAAKVATPAPTPAPQSITELRQEYSAADIAVCRVMYSPTANRKIGRGMAPDAVTRSTLVARAKARAALAAAEKSQPKKA